MPKPKRLADSITAADVKKLLKIDKLDLDTEIERQPEILDRIIERSVLATSQRDFAKTALDRVGVNLDRAIRKKFQDKKPTESEIRNRITRHPEYQKAEDEYLRLKHEADLWSGHREAFKSRSYALRDLVEIFVSGYRERATMSADVNRAEDRRAERNRQRMSESRKAAGD